MNGPALYRLKTFTNDRDEEFQLGRIAKSSIPKTLDRSGDLGNVGGHPGHRSDLADECSYAGPFFCYR
jgi:hypothetical protein